MRFIFILISLSFLSVGCVDTHRPDRGTKPSTKKVTKPIASENFAEQYFLEYASLASDAALETAKKCDANEFKDVTAADDFFNEQTKAARLKANEHFSSAMTSALDDKKGKKASEVSGVYKKVAEGFSSIKKK